MGANGVCSDLPSELGRYRAGERDVKVSSVDDIVAALRANTYFTSRLLTPAARRPLGPCRRNRPFGR